MGLVGRTGRHLLNGASHLADGCPGLAGGRVEQASRLGDRIGCGLDFADDTGQSVAGAVVRLNGRDQAVAHDVRHPSGLADLVGAVGRDGGRGRDDPVGQVVVTQPAQAFFQPGRAVVGQRGQGPLHVAHAADDRAAGPQQQDDAHEERREQAGQDDRRAGRLCLIKRHVARERALISEFDELREGAIDGLERRPVVGCVDRRGLRKVAG